MRSGCNRITLAGIGVAFVLLAGDAWADGNSVDPSYGRVDGDIGVVLGVGGIVAPRGLRGEAEMRLRYLETVGLFATYEDAEVLGSASEPQRVLTMGLEVRPLFLFRWLQGYEGWHPLLDLALDSIGLELGAVFDQPTGRGFASQRGIEVGLAVELPIVARATGPWIGIRGALRWSEAALASGVMEGPDDRQAIVALTIAWHQILGAHLVDVGDRAPR